MEALRCSAVLFANVESPRSPMATWPSPPMSTLDGWEDKVRVTQCACRGAGSTAHTVGFKCDEFIIRHPIQTHTHTDTDTDAQEGFQRHCTECE